LRPGLPGERLMNRLGMPVSDDTILRDDEFVVARCDDLRKFRSPGAEHGGPAGLQPLDARRDAQRTRFRPLYDESLQPPAQPSFVAKAFCARSALPRPSCRR